MAGDASSVPSQEGVGGDDPAGSLSAGERGGYGAEQGQAGDEAVEDAIHSRSASAAFPLISTHGRIFGPHTLDTFRGSPIGALSFLRLMGNHRLSKSQRWHSCREFHVRRVRRVAQTLKITARGERP